MLDVDEVLKSIKKLPPFPSVATRVLHTLDDPDASVTELIPIMQYDQAITANVLKLCNSAYYGLARKVHSLREGLVLLGNSQLKNIILASAVVQFFRERNKGYDLAKGDLWKHAVSTAIVSKLISNKVGQADNPSVFTGALLHDIGKVVLGTFVDEYFEQMSILVFENGYSFAEAEREIFGVGHAEVGGKIAELWNFPEEIVQAIRFHHNPENASEDDTTTPIIYLGNVVTLSMGIGVGRDGLSYRGKEQIMKRFGLKAKHLQEIVVEFYDEYNKVQDILQIN